MKLELITIEEGLRFSNVVGGEHDGRKVVTLIDKKEDIHLIDFDRRAPLGNDGVFLLPVTLVSTGDKYCLAGSELIREMYYKFKADNLLKAMGLYRFYSTDSGIGDDVSMHGVAGVMGRLIGHCQTFSGYCQDDGNEEELTYYSKVARVLEKAIKEIEDVPVPDTLIKDQPYSDGRL